MIQFLLLAAAVVFAAGFIVREVLVLIHDRDEGEELLPLMRRLRRRTKVTLLLLGLFAVTLYYDDIAAWAVFDWRAHLLAAGGVIIAVVWVLILAVRDFQESALRIMGDEEEFTRETLASLEKELRGLGEADQKPEGSGDQEKDRE